MLRILSLVCFCLLSTSALFAQANESPAGAYQWKKGKTEFQDGYVILKSGKRMDGKISLIGSPSAVTEIAYKGDGKELNFPAASLRAYGLINVNPNASTSTSNVPVNESPESMYEWRSMGIVMGKEIHHSVPRQGYMVLKDGTRYEGELKLKRRAGVLNELEIKTEAGKQKADAPTVARYGYTVSQEEVAQSNLAKIMKQSLPGTIITSAGRISGEVTMQPIQGKRYSEKIVFKGTDGKFTEHTPQSITGFTVVEKGREESYMVVNNVFVETLFSGNIFQVYLNPAPTSINKFATSLVKGAAQVGTAAAASAMVKEDQKKNNYTSNMDSIIRVSSTDDLILLRDTWARAAGYSSSQEAINKSDNESLKNNLSALDLAIQGRQVAETEGGILNEEWIIFNKITNEKTVVYKSDYKDQIEVLLMGCEKYLELAKPQQNDMRKWENLAQTTRFLDGCY